MIIDIEQIRRETIAYIGLKRIPRKKKKLLKRLWKHKYGFKWLKCEHTIIEYQWFFKNPFKINMYKSYWKNDSH